MSPKEPEAPTGQDPKMLLYELPDDLVEMTDEQIDAFAERVVDHAYTALRKPTGDKPS